MKHILLFLAAVFILNSCGGEDDPVGLNDISIAPNGSNKVIKIVTVNKTGAAPYDIIYNWNTGRLLSVSTSNNSFSYSIEYTGNLISKITHISGQGTQLETTVSNLIYSNGVLSQTEGVKTTANLPPVTFKTAYTYTTSRPTFVKTQYFAPGTTTVVSTISTLFQYAGVNLSKMNTAFDLGGNLSSNIVTFSNYDANPNPLVKLPPAFTLVTSNAEKDSFGGLSFSQNNFKNIKTEAVGSTVIEDVTYTYSADGYATKSVRPSVTYNFEYINF